ncbi:hypothetical protein [Robertkochia aurantiaca]|uniref:hypothetical protein n=1 Tax=Robertkochia aurantiaca TaxID=2873700 RepID=UPI001CCC2CEA|nr:hypothetical protein [Robertkochia sp. 3YJGBD-33]
MNRYFLLILLLLISSQSLFSQDRDILSIFRVDYSEINGKDVSRAAYDCSMAIIFYKREGQLRISRTCLDGGTEKDDYFQSEEPVIFMESRKEEKWLLTFDFKWCIQEVELKGENIDRDEMSAKALISILSEKNEPLFMFFKTFNDGAWYPNIAIEAELVRGSEAWEKMIDNWKVIAKKRDPADQKKHSGNYKQL